MTSTTQPSQHPSQHDEHDARHAALHADIENRLHRSRAMHPAATPDKRVVGVPDALLQELLETCPHTRATAAARQQARVDAALARLDAAAATTGEPWRSTSHHGPHHGPHHGAA